MLPFLGKVSGTTVVCFAAAVEQFSARIVRIHRFKCWGNLPAGVSLEMTDTLDELRVRKWSLGNYLVL